MDGESAGNQGVMTDRARTVNFFGCHPIAVISDHEVKILRFMLHNSPAPVSISSGPFHVGEKVKVMWGNLAGLMENILRPEDGCTELAVQLDILGYATMKISSVDLELVK